MSILERWAPFVYFGQTVPRVAKGMEGRLWPTCHALYAILDGTVVIRRRDGTLVTLRPGACALVEPGERVVDAQSAHLIRIVFDLVPRPRQRGRDGITRPAIAETQPGWAELLGHPLPLPLPSSVQAAARRIAQRLATLHVKKSTAVIRAGGEFAQFLGSILESLAPGLNADAGPSAVTTEAGFAYRLEELLMREAAAGTNVAEAARQLGMTPRHCIRLYRAQRGDTPGRFLQRWRVNRVKELLGRGQDLTTAAKAVGFASASSLRSCFRRWEGISPDLWRRTR